MIIEDEELNDSSLLKLILIDVLISWFVQ